VVDSALVGRRAADQGEVDFLGGAGLEGGGEARGDLGGAREQKDAAGGAIEAVRRGDGGAEEIAREVGGGDGVVAPAAVDEQAGRLGERRNGVVGVEEREGGQLVEQMK
jgi:hypothetical protein